MILLGKHFPAGNERLGDANLIAEPGADVKNR